MTAKFLTASILLLMLVCIAHAAPIYKWSEEGRVIYSQTPPGPGVVYEIVYEDNLGEDSTAIEEVEVSQDAASNFEKRREAHRQNKIEKRILEESNKIKTENCAIATKNMESLTSRGQVTVKEGDVYRKLTEEERQEKIEKTKAQLSEFCS